MRVQISRSYTTIIFTENIAFQYNHIFIDIDYLPSGHKLYANYINYVY